MRRRGYPAAAIRNFCKTIGMTKFNALTDLALLEHSVREQLNRVRTSLHGCPRSTQDCHHQLARR
ncbi:MAG: hypothetical protein R3F19_30725 [Verrucomicrobiales bacterium]